MAEFDYLVVGAGSAGCVVAARLSEDAGIHVGVVEAGSRPPPPRVAEDIAIPWHWGLVQNHTDEHGRTHTTPVDWGYRSVPQAHCCGREFPEPRGRMPGGSSNLYMLMHIRGHRSDYDNTIGVRTDTALGLQRLPGLVLRRRAALFSEAGGSGGPHQSAGRPRRSAAGGQR
jgi:choline dehydrogenase-like flavoprotein